jgi:hypothetical protein
MVSQRDDIQAPCRAAGPAAATGRRARHAVPGPAGDRCRPAQQRVHEMEKSP